MATELIKFITIIFCLLTILKSFNNFKVISYPLYPSFARSSLFVCLSSHCPNYTTWKCSLLLFSAAELMLNFFVWCAWMAWPSLTRLCCPCALWVLYLFLLSFAMARTHVWFPAGERWDLGESTDHGWWASFL